jgi:hypothetical protein
MVILARTGTWIEKEQIWGQENVIQALDNS